MGRVTTANIVRLQLLQHLKAKLPHHSVADIRVVRGLAFGTVGRDHEYPELIDKLIQHFIPLAVAEQMTQ